MIKGSKRNANSLIEDNDISLREIRRGGTKLIVVPEDSVSTDLETESLKVSESLIKLLWCYFDPFIYNDARTSPHCPIPSFFVGLTYIDIDKCVDKTTPQICAVTIDDDSYTCPKCTSTHYDSNVYISKRDGEWWFFCPAVFPDEPGYDEDDQTTWEKEPSWVERDRWMKLGFGGEKSEEPKDNKSEHDQIVEAVKNLLDRCGGDKARLHAILDSIESKESDIECWKDYVTDFLKIYAHWSDSKWTPTTVIINKLRKKYSLLTHIKDRALSNWISVVLRELGFKASRKKCDGVRMRGYGLIIE